MQRERPDRVMSIDGGTPCPVSGESMTAAIAGLAEGVGRVEVAPEDRVRIRPELTLREARALDLQLNGFEVAQVLHRQGVEDAQRFASGLPSTAEG